MSRLRPARFGLVRTRYVTYPFSLTCTVDDPKPSIPFRITPGAIESVSTGSTAATVAAVKGRRASTKPRATANAKRRGRIRGLLLRNGRRAAEADASIEGRSTWTAGSPPRPASLWSRPDGHHDATIVADERKPSDARAGAAALAFHHSPAPSVICG